MNNVKYIWLSHPLQEDTPSYSGAKDFEISVCTSIAKGNTANTLHITCNNHTGTHVDSPKHFFENGKTITDYPPEFWIFTNPQIIDIACDSGYLIKAQDIENSIDTKTDLLLLRTGFEEFRSSPHYWQNNPGISPDVSDLLRTGFPKIRAIGIDSISVSSKAFKEKGREAHRAFLNPTGSNNAILLIEDMALSRIFSSIRKVTVLPLMINGADGAPCTILAEI